MATHHHRIQEEKQAAIDLCESSSHSPSTVRRTLGCPDASTLSRWYRDYLRRGYARGPDKRSGKFTDEQKRAAVEHHLSVGRNGSRTVRDLGYPGRTSLGQRVDEFAPGARKTAKPHREFTDEGRTDALIGSATAPAAKQAIADRGIDRVAFCNRRKRLWARRRRAWPMTSTGTGFWARSTL